MEVADREQELTKAIEEVSRDREGEIRKSWCDRLSTTPPTQSTVFVPTNSQTWAGSDVKGRLNAICCRGRVDFYGNG